jgi:hypothetical protein
LKNSAVAILATLIAVSFQPNSAHAAADEFVYTKNYSGEIFKMRLDGTGGWSQVGTIGSGVNLMASGNFIYLCFPSIKRMTLTGTGLTTLNSNSAIYNCTTDGNYIYYGYENTQSIGRMNMDGSNANDNWVTFTNSGLNSGWLTVSNGSIYFGGGNNATSKVLAKVSTAGGAVSVIYTDACAISGISADATNVYLSHYGCGNVVKLGTDGTVVTTTFITGLSSGNTWGSQIWNGFLYVLDGGNIAKVKLDGTGYLPTYLTGGGGRGIAISGTASAPTTISSTNIPTSIPKSTSTSLSVTFSAAGKVTFFANGKRIPSCTQISTAITSPYTATCTWKPSVRGNLKLMVSITPTDTANLPLSTNLASVNVVKRSALR